MAEGFRRLSEKAGAAMLIENPELAKDRVGMCEDLGDTQNVVVCARPKGHPGIHAAYWFGKGIAIYSTWLRHD